MAQRTQRELAQRRTDDERTFVDIARQKAAREQLRADAVRGAFRQRELRRQLRERERAALVREQRKQAQAALG